jgi:hypothetical protein
VPVRGESAGCTGRSRAQPRDEGLLAYGLPDAEEGGNEKACGVLGVASGQGKKARHAGIVSEGAPIQTLFARYARAVGNGGGAHAQVRVHMRELQEEL